MRVGSRKVKHRSTGNDTADSPLRSVRLVTAHPGVGLQPPPNRRYLRSRPGCTYTPAAHSPVQLLQSSRRTPVLPLSGRSDVETLRLPRTLVPQRHRTGSDQSLPLPVGGVLDGQPVLRLF